MNADRNRPDPDSFDVRGSLAAISAAAREHRRLVWLTCLLTMALTTLYYFLWPPIYTTTATVMVEKDVDYARDSFYVGWNNFRKDDARTEIELVTAGPVLAEVVQKEKLTFDDVYHAPSTHLAYLWETSWPGRLYRWAKDAVLPADKDAPRPEDVQLARTVLAMRAGMMLEPVGESNVGRLTVKGPSRKVARIANTLLDVYLARRKERYRAEGQRAHDALSGELAQAEKDLREIEARRLEFSRENKLVFDFQKEALEVTKLTDLEADMTKARVKAADLQASIREAERQLAADPPRKSPASVRQAAQHKELELRAALLLARNRYREDSPEIQEIERSLKELAALIAEGSEKVEGETSDGLTPLQQEAASRRNSWRSELAGLRAGLAVMEQQAAALRERVSKVSELQSRMRIIDRELAGAQEKYHVLFGKRAQAAASLESIEGTTSSMRVVDQAAAPERASWPRPLLLFPAALVLSLLLGVGAAVVRSQVASGGSPAKPEAGGDVA